MNRLGIPEIKADSIDIKSMLPFNFALTAKEHSGTIHFYIDDYQFERIWRQPTRYLDLLRRFNGVITPDFSYHKDMPLAVQIYQVYRNREYGRLMQEAGIKIIPCVGWADERSYEFSFLGIEPGGVVSISTMGCVKAAQVNKHGENMFLKGYQAMMEILSPTQIIVYGKPIEGMAGNCVYYPPFYKEMAKRRGQWVDGQAEAAGVEMAQVLAGQEGEV